MISILSHRITAVALCVSLAAAAQVEDAPTPDVPEAPAPPAAIEASPEPSPEPSPTEAKPKRTRKPRREAAVPDAGAPSVAAPTPPLSPTDHAGHTHGDRSPVREEVQVRDQARAFFSNLILGNVRAAVQLSAFPFYLDDRRIDSPDALFEEWMDHLRGKRTDLLTLYGIEVLTPAQMEQRYGKPPARLSTLPWRSSGVHIAIANLSGRAAIALLRNMDGQVRVIAFHD